MMSAFEIGVAIPTPADPNSIDLLAGAIPGTVLRYSAGQEIHGEGESVVYAYRVLSGMVRSFRVLNDGRRQVEAFYLPGQVFGLETGNTYDNSTEAVCATRVLAMRMSTIEKLVDTEPMVARCLLRWASESLGKAREQVVTLGRKTAIEKVASFLIELDGVEPYADHVSLPMSRYDIADYLGLTIETVSRAFTKLQQVNAIELPSARHVVLRDRSALWRLSGHA